MKIKRFFAKDMRAALAEVKETLGPDAVIMSNKRVTGGVEIVAAVDFDNRSGTAGAEKPTLASGEADPLAALAGRALNEDKVSLSRRPPATATPAQPQAPADTDNLRALLERQQERRQQKEARAMLSKQEQALPKWAQRAFDAPKTSSRPEAPKAQPQAQPQPSRRPAPGKASEELSAMKAEMASIRQLLQHQVSNLMQQDLARSEPVRAMLTEQLRDLGFHKEVAEHFARMVPEHSEIHDAIDYLPELVAQALSCGNESMLNEGGVIALVGPTGVGKTTTVAKLAARFVARYGINQVALVTTDNYRIGAQEQLTTFGKIMGCPVRSAASVEELEEVIYQLRSRRLILIDTAGMGQRDMRLVEQLDQLTRSTRLPIKPYLVLSATAQYRVLKETVERFRQIDLAGCIFTKLDEAHNLGEALSVLIQNQLPVCYLTDGQRVPEDLRTADPRYLAERALADDSGLQVGPTSEQQKNVAGLYE
ncbi:flagellar biosynthesis protein FlhF [Ferrimonas balearica]|uniref:flagellar biosynthesis protein FlhF n=1 Tax=Ferrimonas balearica TaxID=44012 RepID=UPI001C9A0ECC|nr:flagellar biosynthesis protein FlhF [Ferrimonas balearica]MBY5990747.1 flagellar biosynthesis protein FlhF [Ferrimonas balearica]